MWKKFYIVKIKAKMRFANNLSKSYENPTQ